MAPLPYTTHTYRPPPTTFAEATRRSTAQHRCQPNPIPAHTLCQKKKVHGTQPDRPIPRSARATCTTKVLEPSHPPVTLPSTPHSRPNPTTAAYRDCRRPTPPLTLWRRRLRPRPRRPFRPRDRQPASVNGYRLPRSCPPPLHLDRGYLGWPGTCALHSEHQEATSLRRLPHIAQRPTTPPQPRGGEAGNRLPRTFMTLLFRTPASLRSSSALSAAARSVLRSPWPPSYGSRGPQTAVFWSATQAYQRHW